MSDLRELSKLERKVNQLQQEIIDRPTKISEHIKHPSIKKYAEELATNYYPRANSAAYLSTAADLFAIDLCVAPYLHRRNYLWRYNYNELDILANFYKWTNHSHKYFHLEARQLDPPTPSDFKAGCEALGINLEPDDLLDAYKLKGTRSRIAARIIESISYAPHDLKLNKIYGFDDDPSKRNLRAAEGRGKYRYLRRGRNYLILGTVATTRTTDLRNAHVKAFDYTISFKEKPQISKNSESVTQLKADLKGILETDSPIYMRMIRASRHYQQIHEKYRFTNATRWTLIDKWLKDRVRKELKAYPKTEFTGIYQAATHKFAVAHLKKRTNFFWNPAELHCNFSTIWTPYNWEEPSCC